MDHRPLPHAGLFVLAQGDDLVHDEVLDQGNKLLLELAKRMKCVNYRGYVSLEIIKKKDLPEELLTETATRLKQLIVQA